MSDELKATIVELRKAREDWKRSGICYSRFITLAWEHLPAILDALEHQRAELKRIGEDQDYLNRAQLANEWEDRFQVQAGQIERLKAALADAEQRAKQECIRGDQGRKEFPMSVRYRFNEVSLSVVECFAQSVIDRDSRHISEEELHQLCRAVLMLISDLRALTGGIK